MTVYALYLESGPKHKTTMAHLPALLGCCIQGPTTEAALGAAPGAARAYLDFLAAHDAAGDPQAPFELQIVEHVTQGAWLGYGDPTPGFSWDFQPLEPGELEEALQRLDWLYADLLALSGGLPLELMAETPVRGRSIGAILEHLAESQAVYLRYQLGKVEGLAAVERAVHSDLLTRPQALFELWGVCRARLDACSPEELARLVPHGQVTWTARRMLRRMCEHAWEHRQELRGRLGSGQV